jgi:hemoglobin
MTSPPPTLLEWTGGEPAIRRLLDASYDRVEQDELLAPLFPGGVSEEHRAYVTPWWVEVFSGPSRYTDERGGYPVVLAHHRNLRITAEQRFRFTTLMSRASTSHGCRTTRSSAPRSSATWSGARGWPCRTPSPTPPWSSRRPRPAGAWGGAPAYQPDRAVPGAGSPLLGGRPTRRRSGSWIAPDERHAEEDHGRAEGGERW